MKLLENKVAIVTGVDSAIWDRGQWIVKLLLLQATITLSMVNTMHNR